MREIRRMKPSALQMLIPCSQNRHKLTSSAERARVLRHYSSFPADSNFVRALVHNRYKYSRMSCSSFYGGTILIRHVEPEGEKETSNTDAAQRVFSYHSLRRCNSDVKCRPLAFDALCDFIQLLKQARLIRTLSTYVPSSAQVLF